MRFEDPALYTTDPGYEVIAYNIPGRGLVHVRLHRLIAVAEYGFDAVCGNDVHHRNRFTWDNRLSNIELLSPSEHMGIHAPVDPPRPDTRKLTLEQEREIYDKYHNAGGYTQEELGDEYGVSQRTISSVVNMAGCSLLSESDVPPAEHNS